MPQRSNLSPQQSQHQNWNPKKMTRRTIYLTLTLEDAKRLNALIKKDPRDPVLVYHLDKHRLGQRADVLKTVFDAEKLSELDTYKFNQWTCCLRPHGIRDSITMDEAVAELEQ
jgi:hypothetical protein